MLKYVIKRILIAVLILFGVSVIIYTLIRLLPNDYVELKFYSKMAQEGLDEEDFIRMKELYGLADGSFFGIIKGYFGWLGSALKGDLGLSFTYNMPVSEVISKYMWLSFAIAFIALIFEFLIAIPLGVQSAAHQYGKLDYAATIFTMLGISLPSFFLSALLIKIFAVDLGWFPVDTFTNATQNWGDSAWGSLGAFFDNVYHLILPITVFIILNIGGMMRYTRTNTLEVLNADYIRTARAKGLSEKSVVYKHAFRNTLIPLVTIMAGILPGLFGGALIIEQVFSIPGIGSKAYKALIEGDIPFIMGYNMFLAVLTVIGTLLSDLMYALVDPRVKLAK